MTVKRMDNVGIVVEDLDAAIEFFTELGLILEGRMRIEGELREVKPGDAIAIPPGKKHKIWNAGSETLRLLCCCAPAYEDSDTVITENP